MDFDNAKENIQPLATGRNASILQAALNTDFHAELAKKRESFETEIINYEGSDPLEPWFEYVSWIEQSYPSGGSEGGLKKVLIKCLEYFMSDQRYVQDRRLIRIYIKFIDSEDNPPELYQELFNAGIGTMVADFYICWAYYYDLSDNFTKADSIFRKGIEVRAQPYNELIQAHQNFGFTMSQRILYQDDISKVGFLESLKNRRIALTSLNVPTVGSYRLANEIISHNTAKLQNTSDKGLCHKQNSTVLEDEHNIPSGINTESSKSIVRNIIECERNKENMREAGPWSKQNCKKKGNLFKDSTNDFGFKILEDDSSTNEDDCQQSSLEISSPKNIIRGIQLPANFSSKNHQQETWTVDTILDNETKPNAIPAYRKNYHYPKPNQDFSLEEYLAYNWFKKKNINNSFLDFRKKFWENDIRNGIRLYPNFVNKSVHTTDNDCETNHEILVLPENKKLAVDYNKIYLNNDTEMQFEEILYHKRDKSLTNLDSELIVNTPNIIDTNKEEGNSSNKNTHQIDNVSPQIIKKKIKEFNARDIDMADKYETNNDLLATDETFSTQQFNLFITKNLVSTPLNKQTQKGVNNIYREQNEEILSTKLLTKDSPESELSFQYRQLSPIMETSEPNTAITTKTYSEKSSQYSENLLLTKNMKKQQDNFNLSNDGNTSNSEKDNSVIVLFKKSEDDNKSNLVHNKYFEKENAKIQTNVPHNFTKINDNEESSATVESVKIFDFLSKTPENKIPKISNKNDDIFLNCTNKNYSTGFLSFKDLSLPQLNNTLKTKKSFEDNLVNKSKDDKNSYFVRNKYFEKENAEIQPIEPGYIKNNEMENLMGFTFLSLDPKESFKKQSKESINKILDNRETSDKTQSMEIFDFLSKTPEKKLIEISNDDLFLSGGNNDYSIESIKFADLSLLSLKTTPKTQKSLILAENNEELEHSLYRSNNLSNTNLLDEKYLDRIRDSKNDLKIFTNLEKNSAFDTDTYKEGKFLTKNIPFKKHNETTNLSLNPINFFEEKTEQFTDVLFKEQSKFLSDGTEIFDFLLKTPEKNDIVLPSLDLSEITPQISECTSKLKEYTPFNSVKKNKQICKKYNENKSVVNYNENNLNTNIFKDTFHSDVHTLINKYENYNVLKHKNLINLNEHIVKGIINLDYAKFILISSFKFLNAEHHPLNLNLKKKALIINKEKLCTISSENVTFQNSSNMIETDKPTKIISSYKYNGVIDEVGQNISQNLSCTISEIENDTILNVNTFQKVSGSFTAIDRLPTLSGEMFNKIPQRFTEMPVKRKSCNKDNLQYCSGNNHRVSKFQRYVKGGTELWKNDSSSPEKIIFNSSKEYINEQLFQTDVNPFSLDLIEFFLQKVDFITYIANLESCVITNKLARLVKGTTITISNLTITINKVIGQGAYGTIFCGIDLQSGKQFAMKHEKPSNLWEYYICLELRNRILNADILYGFMDIQYALIADNASVFLTEFSPYGSLITVCNKVKTITSRNVDEYVVMLLLSQILLIIDHLHASEIIHADIKPDNFLLMTNLVYGSKIPSVQLIDFGVSIDLKQFPRGQQFTFTHKHQDFQCVEMRENRPWTFQVDLYGVATIVHVLLFGKYMEIQKLPRGLWMPKQNIPRYLNKRIWDKVYTELLNVRNCDSMPNLQDLRKLLEQEIVENEKYVKDKLMEFNRAIIT